jgi:hypothetical protein
VIADGDKQVRLVAMLALYQIDPVAANAAGVGLDLGGSVIIPPVYPSSGEDSPNEQ